VGPFSAPISRQGWVPFQCRFPHPVDAMSLPVRMRVKERRWRDPWAIWLESADAAGSVLAGTALFESWRRQYLSSLPLTDSIPRVFFSHSPEALREHAAAIREHVLSTRNYDGWSPVEVALRQTMDRDPDYIGHDLRPYQGDLREPDAIAAWKEFLQREDLIPELRIFALRRVGRLSMNVGESERDPAQTARARARARAIDPDLATYDLMLVHLNWATGAETHMQTARNAAECYRWLASRTDEILERSARRPTVTNWLDRPPIRYWDRESEESIKGHLASLRRNLRGHRKVTELNLTAWLKYARETNPAAVQFFLDEVRDVTDPQLFARWSSP